MPTPDLCIFTANADALLLASAACHGLTVHSYSPNPWKGFTSGKLRDGAAFLQAQDCHIAMWTDGGDSLILKPESVILERISALGLPVLISAERNCWPDIHMSDKYPENPPGSPRHLCAGGFIGPKDLVLAAMYTAIREAVDEDDQRAWTAALTAGLLPSVQIDYGRYIFCSEADGDTAGADPCVRHWNGKVLGREDFWKKCEPQKK